MKISFKNMIPGKLYKLDYNPNAITPCSIFLHKNKPKSPFSPLSFRLFFSDNLGFLNFRPFVFIKHIGIIEDIFGRYEKILMLLIEDKFVYCFQPEFICVVEELL